MIVLGEHADESLVVAALHAGAGDYLTWGRLGRLGSAVGRELRSAQGRRRREDAERTRREAEERYRALIEEIPRSPTSRGRTRSAARVYVSPQIEAMTGYTPAEWLADRRAGRAASIPRTASACWRLPRRAAAGESSRASTARSTREGRVDVVARRRRAP